MKYESTSFLNEVTTISMAAVACCKLTVDGLHHFGCKTAAPNEKERIIELEDWEKMENHYIAYWWPREILEEFGINIDRAPHGYPGEGTLYLVEETEPKQYQIRVLYAGLGFYGEYGYPTMISEAEKLCTFHIEGEEKLDRFHYLVSREKEWSIKQAEHVAWVKEVLDYARSITDYLVEGEIARITQHYLKALTQDDYDWINPDKLKVDYFYLYSKYLELKKVWETEPPTPEIKEILGKYSSYYEADEADEGEKIYEYMDESTVVMGKILTQIGRLVDDDDDDGYDHEAERDVTFSFFRYLYLKESA